VSITQISMIFKLLGQHTNEMEMNSPGFLWFGGRDWSGRTVSSFGLDFISNW